MIRVSMCRAALAGALVWLVVQAGPAQDKKEPAKPAAPPAKTEPSAKPEPSPIPDGPAYLSPQAKKINEYIRKGYESAGIKKPAAKATDNEFLRRVCIDLIGRIATPEEIADFEADKSPDKRVKLVQRLLGSQQYTLKGANGQPITVTVTGSDGKPKKEALKKDYPEEYAHHWADLWTTWLMSRTGHATYRYQMHTWLEEQFSITDKRPNISHKDMVTKLITATGKVGGPKASTYDESFAAAFVMHHLGEPVKDKARDGGFDAIPLTSRVTKLFLGIQTQCTQCHDHPLTDDWKMEDFWGVNAFFRQTFRSATPSLAPAGNNAAKMDAAVAVTITDQSELNAEMITYYERRDGRLIGTTPLMIRDYAQAQAREKSKKAYDTPIAGKTRRQQLAEWVVVHDNFSKAYVNRMWAHCFGRGLNKEAVADDFNANNEVVHPEMLDYLAQEFAKYNYDPKRLMEWICTSDVYSLSHVGVKEYLDVKFDPFFARMPMKAMSPEVLFESLMTATGTMAVKKKDSDAATARRDARNAWMGKLVRQFGDDEGNELNFNGTIVQALLMMNGAELNGEIGVGRGGAGANIVQELMKKTNSNEEAMYKELFLLTLNRVPTGEEVKKLKEVKIGAAKITLGAPAPKGPPPKSTTPIPKGTTGPSTMMIPPVGANEMLAYYQDVLWALLNTSEFLINH